MRLADEGRTVDILVTGANGFVGDALSPALLDAGHHVTGLVRDSSD